jgi:signal transduction histidine kinase
MSAETPAPYAGMSAVRSLVRESLACSASRPGLRNLIRIVTEAVGGTGGLLWEQAAATEAQPSLRAIWIDRPVQLASLRGPDPATAASFESHSLVLGPHPEAGSIYGGLPVWAAFPLQGRNGRLCSFTLLGQGDLALTFEVAVDLLELLPDLYDLVREREAMVVIHRCTDILRQADRPSATPAVDEAQLSRQFGEVAGLLARTLECRYVSIFLGRGAAQPSLFASSDEGAPAQSWASILGRVGRSGHPEIQHADMSGLGHGSVVAMPLMASGSNLGAIVCSATAGSPTRFSAADLDLLDPVAAQLAQSWSNWLHRERLAKENDVWRQLAAGITTFNKVLSEQLGKRAASNSVVLNGAGRIIEQVVADRVGSDVRLPVSAEDRTLAPFPLRGRPGVANHCQASGPLGDGVFRGRRQRATDDPAALAREGLAPPARWLVTTPIRLSDHVYGVLDIFGSADSVPPHCAQVAEIVADQLGLFMHLQRTMEKLQSARADLQATIRGQADSLQDLKHQLNSPLNTAISRVEAVLKNGQFDRVAEYELKKVRGLCRRAFRVVTSAGVFALLSTDQDPAMRFDLLGIEDLLPLLIANADDAQTLGDPARSIKFTVDRESVRAIGRGLIEVDRSFLEQCVGNVLDNAYKYSFAGTSVRIEGAIDDDFILSVTSVGLRLTPEDARRCVLRNWRGDAARHSTGEGSGLGLWIVDRLMRCMSGDVRVVPVDDTTTVRLRFPVRKRP